MRNDHGSNVAHLDEAVEQLARRPVSSGPSKEQILRTAAAMRVAGARRGQYRRWLVAAAAAILICGGTIASLLVLDRTTPIAFAAVAQRVAEAQANARSVTWNSGEGPMAIRNSLKGDRLRMEGNTPDSGGSWTRIIDLRSGDDFTISPESKNVTWRKYRPAPDNPYDLMRNLAKGDVKPLGEQRFGERKLVGFSGTMEHRQHDGMKYQLPVKVWVAKDTQMPVRIEHFDAVSGKFTYADDEIRFDVPLDDKLFAFEPPAGFEVADERGKDTLALKPAAAGRKAEDLVIRPGVGIGVLRLGDPPARVVEILGESERPEKHDLDVIPWSYDYPSLGLRLTLTTRKGAGKDGSPKEAADLGLHTVFADDDNTTWAGKKFAGVTPEGIRIGSTRAQVEAAYGKPSWENAQNADYRRLGLAVFFRPDGKVVSGFAIKAPSEEPFFHQTK
jgi:hypothetical protein